MAVHDRQDPERPTVEELVRQEVHRPDVVHALGICPAVVAPWLVRKIGAGRARTMLLAGGTMTGEAGFEAGLATHLCAADRLDATVSDLAGRLAAGGPNALATTKRWLNELDGSMDDAVLDRAAELSAQIIAGAEAQERLHKAFAGR